MTRSGQRLTFTVNGEKHVWHPHDGEVKLTDAQQRESVGAKARMLGVTNALDPAEQLERSDPPTHLFEP